MPVVRRSCALRSSLEPQPSRVFAATIDFRDSCLYCGQSDWGKKHLRTVSTQPCEAVLVGFLEG